MRFGAFAILFAAILAGCQSSPSATSASVRPPAEAIPYKLTPPMIEKVKAAVARLLKDPESARFNSPFVASKTPKGITVCGFVNAKNSFGGYTGDKPFLVGGDGDSFTAIGVGGSESEITATLQVCRNEGAEPVR